jgi:ubiquinone/menaquinone biosynthesis C-methylase UbiE
MSHQSNQVLGKWGESAFYWEKHRETIERMFAPITRAMLEDTRFEPNQLVLDVAGGTGEPSLTIAREFGALVSIVSTDPVAEMVMAARRESRRRGLTNVAFCQCAGERLPFESDRFDRTICRLGVMFFPDIKGGLQEILRVTRPEGRVTLAVWHSQETNPIFHIVTDCLARYIPSPREHPGAPDPFRFARLGVLASLLRQAGAEEVTERLFQFSIEAPLSIDQFWTVRSEMSETLRDKLAQLTSEQLIQVSEEVKEAVWPFFAEGDMRFPAEVILVTGKKR